MQVGAGMEIRALVTDEAEGEVTRSGQRACDGKG